MHSSALIIGPPGTGKTFTVGAAVANLLARSKNARILLVGPTNTAVDTALVAADDWLLRNGREDLRAQMKRIGSRFDTRRYADRPHLLAAGLHEASVKLTLLELDEPGKADITRYVAWKENVERARKSLRTDTEQVALGARLVAMTTASLFIHQEAVRAAGPWHFAICDEASQIMLPAALMAASFAAYSTFAGDPNQLAPIVQAGEPWVEASLGASAFDALPRAKVVHLNEQSRMSVGICDVVSATFYDNGLRVCSKATRDKDWKAERSPWYLNGREVPRVMFDDRAGPSTWSAKYNGLIRFGSAQIVEALVAELLGSYVKANELLVLTPFRAQRALIRTLLKREAARQIRSQHGPPFAGQREQDRHFRSGRCWRLISQLVIRPSADQCRGFPRAGTSHRCCKRQGPAKPLDQDDAQPCTSALKSRGKLCRTPACKTEVLLICDHPTVFVGDTD